MPTIKELMAKHGMTPADTSRKSTKQRLRDQADNMLKKLNKMKSASELDSKNSTANWWANKPTADNKRYVCMKYGGTSVADTGSRVQNSLQAVKDAINTYIAMIDESDAETWREEEERREELKRKRKAKQATDDA